MLVVAFYLFFFGLGFDAGTVQRMAPERVRQLRQALQQWGPELDYREGGTKVLDNALKDAIANIQTRFGGSAW